MKKILIIGAGPLQVPAYIEARKVGLRSIALDRNPSAPGMALADKAFVIDTADADGAIRVAKSEKIDGVMTLCTDFPMVTVAAVNEALDLPGLRPKQAAMATHKGLMREAFERASVPIPRFIRAFDDARIAEAVASLGLPAILKPTRSSGSRGIYKLTDAGDLAKAVAHVRSIAGEDGEVLVEEFVEGPEVSVEAVSFGGEHHVIAITDKQTTGSPHWVETGHSQPSRLPEEVLREIAAVTEQGLSSLEIMDSTSHSELKVGPNGPRIIEIGARLGGDFITTELTPRSTGVNMVRAAIQLALGVRPDVKSTRDRGVAVRYAILKPGRVVAIHGREEVARMPGVVSCRIDIEVGDVVRPVHSSLDRPCHVICEGDGADQAEGFAVAALTALDIEVEGDVG